MDNRAAVPRESAAAASGKISVISTSLRRGAASEIAPTAVTRSERRRHRDQLPPPAPPGEHRQSGQGEDDDQRLNDPPGGAFHRFADPGAPHPPGLAHGHRQVSDRVFAEVVGEVLLADLAQRRVARQVWVAIRDPIEERRRVDFFQRPRVRVEVAVQVALREDRLDPLVFAVGGQEGADVERLAAAGRDRHGAVEDDLVAYGPGDDRQQQGGEEQRRARQGPAASRGRGRPGSGRAARRRRRPAGTQGGTSR